MDDDPVNQMVIQTMLSKAGFKVLKAADGQKALDMLEVGGWRACAWAWAWVGASGSICCTLLCKAALGWLCREPGTRCARHMQSQSRHALV